MSIHVTTVAKISQEMKSRNRTKDGATALRQSDLMNTFAVLKVLRQDVTGHDAAIVIAEAAPDKLTAGVGLSVSFWQKI
jgi:hypothetical protein